MLKRRGGLGHIVPEWNLHKYKISNNVYLQHYSYFILISRIVVALLPVSLRGLCYRFVRFRSNGHSVGLSDTAVLPKVACGGERAAVSVLEIPFHGSGCGKTKEGIDPLERDDRSLFQDQG